MGARDIERLSKGGVALATSTREVASLIEDGRWTASEEGSPQGATVSPLLANVYLHYVFDLWIQQWRSRHARGEVIVVRGSR
jgi:hypothetical protein